MKKLFIIVGIIIAILWWASVAPDETPPELLCLPLKQVIYTPDTGFMGTQEHWDAWVILPDGTPTSVLVYKPPSFDSNKFMYVLMHTDYFTGEIYYTAAWDGKLCTDGV